MAGLKLPGHVYLIRAVGTPRYKIGRSQDAEIRLAQIQGQSPYPLEVIASYWHGDTARQELRLHLYASEYRVFGEWFELPDSWVENLDIWFFNLDAKRSKKKVLFCQQAAERARSKREAERGTHLIKLVSQDETAMIQALRSLNEARANEVFALIKEFQTAYKAVRKLKGSNKLVALYKEIVISLKVLPPAEPIQFDIAVKDFLYRMQLYQELANKAKKEHDRQAKAESAACNRDKGDTLL